MKMVLLGALAGAGLVTAAVFGLGQTNEALAQRPAQVQGGGPAGDLLVVPLGAAEKSHLLAVIEPKRQVLGVYQIDPVSGKIMLRSVRNLRWDLQMMEFNGENPLPREIRSFLEQK